MLNRSRCKIKGLVTFYPFDGHSQALRSLLYAAAHPDSARLVVDANGSMAAELRDEPWREMCYANGLFLLRLDSNIFNIVADQNNEIINI